MPGDTSISYHHPRQDGLGRELTKDLGGSNDLYLSALVTLLETIGAEPKVATKRGGADPFARLRVLGLEALVAFDGKQTQKKEFEIVILHSLSEQRAVNGSAPLAAEPIASVKITTKSYAKTAKQALGVTRQSWHDIKKRSVGTLSPNVLADAIKHCNRRLKDDHLTILATKGSVGEVDLELKRC